MANCNRQQLNITCGTDVVLHDRLIFEGETFDPNLSVGITANLVSSLGKRTALDVQVVDDELLISVPWIEGTLPGCYGLEVTGSCNSKKWATYADSLIKYTKATRIGVSEVTVESDSYDITQEVGFRYGEGGNVNDVKVNGVSVVSAGKANITIPSNVGAFENDKNYQTGQQVAKSIQDNLVPNAVVTVDDNTGTPSATVTKTGNTLNFAFRNLKGGKGDKGDTGQTGATGPQGATGVYDSQTQDFLVTLETTTGQSQTKTMTQKTITDEFDMRTSEGVEIDFSKYVATTWYISGQGKWAVGASLSANSSYVIPIEGGEKYIVESNTNYDCNVEFLATYAPVAGETPDFAESRIGAFRGKMTLVAPSTARYLYVRNANTNVAAYLPKSVVEMVSIKNYINKNASAIAELQDIIVVPQTIYFAKYVPSTWYISGAGLWAVGTSLSANSSYVIPIEGGEKYIVESSTSYDCNVEFLATYDPVTDATPDFAESRIGAFRGTRTLIAPSNARYLYVRNANTNVAAYLPKSVVEMVPVNKAIPSNVPLYAYERNYSNLAGILDFEAKEISAQGISDSNDKMLAKLPNRGYIEVRLNRAVGGFSVWKKNGNVITNLKEYNFSQYRYIGDYASEYYVMVQLEQNDPPMESIVSVYTYGDFGVRTSFDVPSWIKGKKIAFVGDSIVQGAQGKNIIMDKPWPVFVAEAVGSLNFVNFGIGGALVYGNEWKSVYNNAANVQDFDVVFVCAGTNDYGGKTSEANFESAYTSVIETLMANNTKVIAMTPVNRTKTVSSPAMSFAGYCDSVIDVASSLGVDVIYMHQFTNNESFNSHLVDGLHPDEMGQRMIADILLEQIKNLE